MHALTARRHLLAIGLGLAIALPAHALPGDETMLLDICINERCVGVAAVIARGDDVLVDRAALDAAGIDATGVTPEHLGERDFISLHQLNHGSTFRLDRNLLRLDLKLRADRLPRQRVSMATRAQAEAGLQPWSAFLNYAASAGDRDQRSLYLDGAIGRGNAALRSASSWDAGMGWQRGLTRFEYDQPDAVRRWTVGDQIAVARDPLGGGRLIGGVGVERAFDTDPYLVTFPQPYYSGVLESPGTVEVYANGTLVGRRELAAGPFTLEQLGIQPGRNDVRVIVSDPFGNRSELASRSYYGGSPRLLAKNLSEYAVRIGAPRADGGLGNGDYVHATAYQAWYRRGLSDDFTLGGRIEGDDTLRNAGLDAALRTPLGEFALAWAASDADGPGRGNAHALNYSLSLRWMSLGLGVRRADAAYRNLNDPASRLLGTLRVDDYASVAFSPVGGFALQFNAGRQRREGGQAERTYGTTGSWQLWDRGSLFLSAQRIQSPLFRDTSVQLSLNIALARDSLNFNVRQRDTGNDTLHGYGFDARRSRPAGNGWGYSASLQRDGDFDSDYGQVEYQGAHARVALEGTEQDGHASVRGYASGALVALGGRVFATPPVESGFALVRAPGMANVPILRENQEVGRTDAHGDLLVRELLPFQANRIALDESAVPVGWSIDTPRRSVQVARNTGSVVLLEGAAVHAVTGHFHYAGAAPGDEVVIGDADATPMGTDGLFYVEGLSTGHHAARIDAAGGAFECAFDVPDAKGAGIVDLGSITCGAPR